ncbi:MAG TPA: hypothetical protein VGN26_17670 [Armatimonadota bacterium]
MAFNPKQHLMKVRGGAEYLEVKWRLVWFREEHPDWGIETKPVVVDIEKGLAVFQAHVYNAEGRLLASGTKMETARDFGDFVEKAETGSIGRALAVCGYGTQFAPEMEEGDRIVDAPIQPNGGSTPTVKPMAPPAAVPAQSGGRATPKAAAQPQAADSGKVGCSTPDCPAELTRGQADYSQKVYGRPMCPACQKRHVRGETPEPAAA